MLRFLVIDDDRIVVETLALLLKSRGHSVITALGGEEGLVLCNAEAPDIVVTDILMPECDGLEVIKAIRKTQSETKIVAMSAGGLLYKQDVLRIARRMGADEVLTKPFSADEVFDVLAPLVDNTDTPGGKAIPIDRSCRAAA